MAKKSTNTVKAKTIFQHLSGIKEKKESWESLSEMDKKSFTPFYHKQVVEYEYGITTYYKCTTEIY